MDIKYQLINDGMERPAQWRHQNNDEIPYLDYNGVTKYRTMKGQRYSINFIPWDCVNECDRIDVPHYHSAVITYSKRETVLEWYGWQWDPKINKTVQVKLAQPTQHHSWKIIYSKRYECADIPEAFRDYAEWKNIDLTEIATQALL